MKPSLSAAQVIELLGLQPHPEGGFFVETWRHDPGDGSRGAGTSIYFLLERGQRSHWHRIDAHEQWHHYAGAPLELSISVDGDSVESAVLGTDIFAGQRPQLEVAPRAWQSARSLGDWTLVGCTVSPAFVFEAFELAPPDWAPGQK